MRKRGAFALALFLSFLCPRAFAGADIAAIHANALPQETAVLDALDDARQLEPYSQSWTMNWDFPIAKDEVATRLGKDLGFLKLALKDHPDNEELLLLTGLVARYAYNLDVEGSYDAAMSALGEAQKLASDDVRAPWFRASLQCQTDQPKAGAEEFLSIESGHAWNQLPVEFWDDYMECASVTNMPAHVLRAAGYLEKLNAPPSQMRNFLAGTAQKRFDPYDPKKDYQPKEVWWAENDGGNSVFTSTSCGVRLSAHGNWAVNRLELDKGTCLADFSTGPYKAAKGDLHPSVLLLVRQAQEDETLQEFAAKFAKEGTFEPFAPSKCPAADCVALKGVQPGMYGKNGDGHGRIVAFERDQPAFPGLIFETPSQPSTQGAAPGPSFYRPDQTQQRMPGKLYYLVVLDTAASIEEPALKDFDFFLQNLVVE